MVARMQSRRFTDKSFGLKMLEAVFLVRVLAETG
jgi:hypothetical protein